MHHKDHFSDDEVKQDFEDIDVSDIIDSVLQQIPIPRNITIEYPKNIPVIFYQIFLNLLTNAIKYNDKEEGKNYNCF